MARCTPKRNGPWLTVEVVNDSPREIEVASASIRFLDDCRVSTCIVGGGFVGFVAGSTRPRELPAVLPPGATGVVRFAVHSPGAGILDPVSAPPDWRAFSALGLRSIEVDVEGDLVELMDVPWPTG